MSAVHHNPAFHAANAAITSVSLASIMGWAPAWSAVAALVYYIILIWKEGVIQSGYNWIKSRFQK